MVSGSPPASSHEAACLDRPDFNPPAKVHFFYHSPAAIPVELKEDLLLWPSALELLATVVDSWSLPYAKDLH